MVIYVDVLVFLNFLVTYFLLLSLKFFTKSRPKRLRLLLGALFGGFSSLVIFLPSLNFFAEIIIKGLICGGTVFVTYGFSNYIRFIKLSLFFLCVTYIYAGSCIALYFALKPKNMAVGNSIVYFNISPLLLIIFTAICYAVLSLINIITTNSKKEAMLYECEVHIGKCITKLRVLNDTGNSLSDPYFSRPVAVIEREKINLPENQKYYLIPIKCVGETSLANAFCPDKFFIEVNGKRFISKNITIALTTQNLHKEFDGLISPQTIDNLEEYI